MSAAEDFKASKRPALGHLAHAAIVFWLGTLISEYCMWNAYAGAWDGVWSAGVNSFVPLRILVVVFVAALALAFACLALKRRGKSRNRTDGLRLENLRAQCATFAQATLPVALAFACSCACSGLYWKAWENDAQWLQRQASQGELLVELVGDPALRDYGQVSQAQLLHGGHAVSFRVLWPQDNADEVPMAGHCVKLTGSLKAAAFDDSGRWNHKQGYVGTLKAERFELAGNAGGLRGLVTPLRDASAQRVAELGGDAAGLLGGILLGDKTQYSGSELEQDFKTCGLAHLMAVSGTHLAVVMALAGWLLARLPLRRIVRALLLALLVSAYVALTAFAPSAMRACVMAAVGLGGFMFSRRRHVLSSLALCVIIFLAMQPSLAFSLGYQLSVLCMVGLLVLSPLVSAWMGLLFKGRLGALGEAVAATLAANLMTLPVTIPLFCQLPLISPVSTFLASPFITVALGLGIPALLIAAVLPALGNLLLGLAGTVAAACAALVHVLADVPGACVPLDTSAGWLSTLCLLGVVTLWAVWPLPRAETAGGAAVVDGGLGASWDQEQSGGRAGCSGREGIAWGSRRSMRRTWGLRAGVVAVLLLPVLLVLLLEMGGVAGVARLSGMPVESDAQVVMLDVGQGDAMLVRDGDAAVLVDTGEEGTVLLKALARQGVSSLDAVLLSHKDSDHTGALSSLAGIVGVRHVMMHQGLVGSELIANISTAARWVTGGSDVEGVSVGDTVRVGRFTLRLLAPQEAGQSENDDSLIWLLSFDEDGDGKAESRGLLVGDGEQGAIEPVYRDLGDIEFYKVAHHGSRDAISEEEMSVLKPELSLVSVGADNTYGHPTQETLQVLEAGGSKVFRTDLQGDITLSFEGTRIGVKTQKEAA